MLYLWTQNYSQIIDTCPGHHGQLISQNCVLTKIRAEPPLIFQVSSSTCIQYILLCVLGLTTAFKFRQSARASKFICYVIQAFNMFLALKYGFSRLTIVCKIPLRARRTRRASQARDDRVFCSKTDDVSRRVDIVDQCFFLIC